MRRLILCWDGEWGFETRTLLAFKALRDPLRENYVEVLEYCPTLF
jgi:hypothetical protein